MRAMQQNPALRLREKFHTDAEIAAKFKDLTRQAVNLWMTKGIPPDRALEVEEVTSGDITAMDILRFYKQNRSAPRARGKGRGASGKCRFADTCVHSPKRKQA